MFRMSAGEMGGFFHLVEEEWEDAKEAEELCMRNDNASSSGHS